MSYQNNIAKESLSLQNHIVRLCFIFVTQNSPIMHNPGFSQAIGSYFSGHASAFSTLTQYMSVSHRHSTLGGVEYDDWDYVRKQKGESLVLTWLFNGLWICTSIDVNMRSRDCHATDALEL